MPPDHITRYDVMPIPPLESQTTWFDAGAVRIGVEYRLLDEAIAAASSMEAATGDAAAGEIGADRGVALHVCGTDDAGRMLEYLRFDCFDEDPHYHYVSWRDKRNEMIHIDPVAEGDPLAWALERIRFRLPQMLVRAGAADVATRFDPMALEAALPRIAEAAYRARYDHDDTAIRAAAAGAQSGPRAGG
jgi:hypothetical protein